MSSSSLLWLNGVLALMMFGIALNLRLSDFQRVLRYPKGVLTGLVAQIVLLPAFTFAATMLLPIPAEIALGLLLVASCPGGSFSNIVTYLAGGNAALSVSMTAVASLAATVLTPFNFMLYASLNPATAALLQSIAVPAEQLYLVVGLVLALPLALGLMVGRIAPAWAVRMEPWFRHGSLLALFGFVALALASNWAQFVADADWYLLAVVAHNAFALLLGFSAARLMQLNRADQRAITFEVGLQNSGLGLGIIFTFFSGLGEMAIIAAGWGICHLIAGMSLCFFWQARDRKRALAELAHG
jgi:BASS family bile acid:Na+ symporter